MGRGGFKTVRRQARQRADPCPDGDNIVNKLTGYGVPRGCRLASLALVGALTALPVCAASPRLDSANAHLVKAAALLDAASYTGEPVSARAHRQRAIRLVEQAEREIARARQAADAPPGPKPGVHGLPRTNLQTAPPLR